MPETTVLIADDAPAAKRSLRRILSGLAGFRLVGEASDGREALRMALECLPQILITDIRMPFLDGLSLVAELRKRSCNVVVVILSGYAEFEYARTAIRHGVTDYLLKPIVPEEVARVLHRIRHLLQGDAPAATSLPLPVRKGLEYIGAHYTRPDLSLTEVAEASGCSPAHFSRLFKRAAGTGYAEHLRRLRLELAAELLAKPHNHVREVAYYCGYSSYSHFERVFREAFGASPTQYRQNGPPR